MYRFKFSPEEVRIAFFPDSEQPVPKIVNDPGLVVREIFPVSAKRNPQSTFKSRRYRAHNSLELERFFFLSSGVIPHAFNDGRLLLSVLVFLFFGSMYTA